MKRKISECATLGEYRREILQLPQHEVARRAKCQQGWISQVELGRLPRTWNREELLKAYELEARPQEFERMILTAARMKAMQKPLDPLFASIQNSVGAVTPEQIEVAAKIINALAADRFKTA